MASGLRVAATTSLRSLNAPTYSSLPISSDLVDLLIGQITPERLRCRSGCHDKSPFVLTMKLSETKMAQTVGVFPIEAFERFIADEPDTVLTRADAARRLLTNSLVGLGLLPIPEGDG